MKTLLLVEFDDERSASIVEPGLRTKMGFSSSVLRAPAPEVRTRGWQTSAEDLLSEVCRLRVANEQGYALGLTNTDMFVPELNFAFGLASEEGRCAVVSTSRLTDASEEVYSSRLLKEAVHELGHVLGFEHCDDPGCVMHFSNSLDDTDRKSTEFCNMCSLKVDLQG